MKTAVFESALLLDSSLLTSPEAIRTLQAGSPLLSKASDAARSWAMMMTGELRAAKPATMVRICILARVL